jgi:hypothetical protein
MLTLESKSVGAVVSMILIEKGLTLPLPFFPLQDVMKLWTSSKSLYQLLSSSRSLGTGLEALDLYDGMYPMPERCVIPTSIRSDIRRKTLAKDVLDVMPSKSREAFRKGTTRGTLKSGTLGRVGEPVGRKRSEI